MHNGNTIVANEKYILSNDIRSQVFSTGSIVWQLSTVQSGRSQNVGTVTVG